jgi:hypothetical protein
MTKKLTTDKAPGFARGPGSQLGTKSRAILEILSRGKPTNKLDLEMMLGYRVQETLGRLQQHLLLKKSTYGSGNGCYEITGNGRIALGEKLASPPPAYAPFINSTMTEIYNPAVHNTARIGVARA